MIRRTLPVLIAIALSIACGKDKSPTAPSPLPSTPTQPTRITVLGVVSGTGGPVLNASVRAAGPESTSGTASTDGNGYYSIAGIAPGSITLTVTAGGFADLTDTFTAQADARRDVALVSTARFALLGMVKDGSGQPLSGVSVTGINVLTQTNVRTFTDRGGFYHLAGIAPGPVTIDWTRFDLVSRSERIVFENGDVRRDISMSLQVQTPPTLSCGAPSIVTCINGGHRGIPTARCDDGAWSCSTTPSGTCSGHGGIACRVCPGPLC